MQWPEIAELHDVTIAPSPTGNSKSRLALAAHPPSPLLGHFRYGLPKSFMRILPLSASEAERATVIEEPVIYGGPLFRHFGHALSESIHRLWPRFALEELRAAKVAFTLVNNSKVMPYVIEALNLHGYSGNQVIRIDRPLRFRRLIVGPQARQMAGPTIIPGYQSMLDRTLERRLGTSADRRRLYISRMHHHHTGSFYGESFVETALAAEGFEVIYPERHSLTQLVSMLRASSIAVFAEGSAIHALELCGSATPAVFVIGRRSRSVDRFTPLLHAICRDWMVSDRLLFNVGMSQDPKKHSGVIDVSGVLDDLWSFADLKRPRRLDRARSMEAIRWDLEQHIGDPRNDREPDYEVRAQLVRELVRSSTPASPPQLTLMPAKGQTLAARILSKISSIGAKWKLSLSRNMSL
jgi:hypothetical protein